MCDSPRLPWVVECLTESDPNFDICNLLHDHFKKINQMSLTLQFSRPQIDLFIGSKKIELDQSTAAGNSLDIKVRTRTRVAIF